MFEIIKSKTSGKHAALEKVLVGKLKSIQKESDYSDILLKFYQFYSPLEHTVHRFITSDILPDVASRKKLHLLSSDLKNLGRELPAGPPALVEIKSLSHALGIMYVMEGSTLGGRIITQMIQQTQPQLAESCSYFTSYGEETVAMWNEFKTSISSRQADLNLEEMISSADETFSGLHYLFTN